MQRWIAVTLIGLSATSAGWAQQTVYRCGPDGREYSQAPCADGKAVHVGDERSAEQRSSAEARAREEAARGQAMERERRANEAAARPTMAGKLDHHVQQVEPKPAESHTKASKKKKHAASKGEDDFKAVQPGTSKKHKSKAKNSQAS